MRLAAIALAAAAALTAAAPVMGSEHATVRAPVVKLKTQAFGAVLATRGKKALYYWNVEKKAGFKIRCTGSCAALWPPLIVPRGTKVAPRLAGFSGRFGTIRRPDGRLQVTYKRSALYSYVHDPVGKVLCNNVNGWFVVRA